MKMRKDIRSLSVGFLCLLVLGIMLILCTSQPYLYTGFRVSSSDFEILELFDTGPAYYSGVRLGDKVIRINDIDTEDFANRYYGGKNSVWYTQYPSLFSKGTLYNLVTDDGETHTFRTPEYIPFLTKITLLSIDDKVGFSVGALFILLGILLSLFSDDEYDKSPFINFLYATGILLANAYSDARNTLFYSVCNLMLFQLSSAALASSMFQIVAFFYRLAGRQKWFDSLNAISFIPYGLTVVRVIVCLISPVSFFDSVLFYLPYLNLIVLIYGVVTFFFLIHLIPPQSSLTIRFFLISICFSIAPAFMQLLVRSFSSSLSVASNGESLMTFLPLLFIPVSLFCCFLQTKKTQSDIVVSKIMISGCTALVLLVLANLPFLSSMYRGLLVFCAAFGCFFMEKPLMNYLYPQIDFLADSFSDLEKLLFACDNEQDMYALVADWLYNTINPSFIVFYELPDDAKKMPGKTLFQKYSNRARADACLVNLIASRSSDVENSERILIHDNWGISAPIFKAHHVFGYVFIGARNQYEMFSSTEIHLLQPAARILMEALLVLDLKQQVEYISNMQNRIVYSFADMIESRDGTTGQHVKRTSLVVDLLTKYLKRGNVYADQLKPEDYGLISLAAPLHDIGKIKVPDRILSKPGKLTDEEFAIIKTHPVVGEKIINKTMFKIEDERYLKIAREMALYHHEKWNGTGYPEGLKDSAIPISARIMAVADVFDALCSARSYKKAFTIEEAFRIIDESKGTHFEPVLVDAMHALESELTVIYASEDNVS